MGGCSCVAADGTTVLLTTQYLEEADVLAHRIVILDAGRIVAHGHPRRLKRRVPGGRIRLEFGDEAALDRAAGVLRVGDVDRETLTISVANEGGTAALRDMLDRLDAAACHRSRRPVRGIRGPRRRLPVPDGTRQQRKGGNPMTAGVMLDSTTILRRSLRRMRRYPSLTFFIAVLPVVFLLLFVYVFGAIARRGFGAGARG